MWKWIFNQKGFAFAVTTDFTANTTISSSQMNTNFSDCESAINSIEDYIGTGVISNAMLATISTAGKVSGAALTGFSAIPSAAGVIPGANVFESGDVLLSTIAKTESGWTEITSTYSGKYLRVGSTGLATGGSASHTHTAGSFAGPSHTHTVSRGTYTRADGQNYIGITTAFNTACISADITSGADGTGAITGTSAAGDNLPLYVDLRMFQLN